MNNLELNLNHDTVMFNLLFSKPVKIEYVEWNETFSKAWNQISQSSVNRRDTNMLYPDALERRPKKLMPKKMAEPIILDNVFPKPLFDRLVSVCKRRYKQAIWNEDFGRWGFQQKMKQQMELG